MRINISDSCKFVWWNVGACASRTTSSVLGKYYDMWIKGEDEGTPVGFKNWKDFNDNSDGGYVHEYYTTYKDYTTICSVRNPYSWVVKEFDDRVKQGVVEDNFEKYIKELKPEKTPPFRQVVEWESKRYPDYYIKFEDLYGSFKDIPVLADRANDEVKEAFEWDTWREWKSYYNEELANTLYNSSVVKKLFEVTDYKKDSWK
tara:strand:- start:256 stop:861 length:606 start_codon:yes stop_codon:yes gene_type:complete